MNLEIMEENIFKISMPDGFNIDVKRFYIGNKKIKYKCNCGKILVYDFNYHYLSFPTIGEDDVLYFYCDECNNEYELPYKLESIDIILDLKFKHES